MAAALGVPVIAIFRNTSEGSNPARWRPCTDRAIVFHEDSKPDPYVNNGFSCDYRRRDEVFPGDILEAAKEMFRH